MIKIKILFFKSEVNMSERSKIKKKNSGGLTMMEKNTRKMMIEREEVWSRRKRRDVGFKEGEMGGQFQRRAEIGRGVFE